MLKGIAKKTAANTLRHGHFVPPVPAAPYVRCPECRQDVARECAYPVTPSRIATTLRDALVEHLTDEH